MSVLTRRAYDPPAATDGRRYLIDRLWPRGVSREQLRLDGWLKELSPSVELRTWFGHEPSRYPEFRRRFRTELAAQGELVDRLVREARAGPVTLVFGARDPEHANASVLRELLEERLRRPRSRRAARAARPNPSRGRPVRR